MANVIKHKRGSGSDPVANNLVLGELAIRTDTGKLFTKMDSGAIAEIAGGGSDIAINTLSSSSATGGGSATFNGSAYRFTLSAPPSVSAQQLLVSINGVIQKPVAGTGQPSEGFSVDGTDIILGDAPATGSDFFILTFKSLGVSEPADNSVTSAKIVDGTIVNADINASAAIAGTKISPDFGSQNITTTGSLGASGFNTTGGEIALTGTVPRIGFTDSNANSDFRLKVDGGSFQIEDITNSSADRLVIDSSGRVGIGCTPTAQFAHNLIQIGNQATLGANAALSTTGQTFLTHNLYFDTSGTFQVFNTSNANEGAIISLADGLFKFSNSAATTGTPTVTERFRIDSSGNVGIGQTNPAAFDKFVVQGTGNVISAQASSGSVGIGLFESNVGRFFLKSLNGSDGIAFVDADNSSERMRIDSSGNLNIGLTSSPVSSNSEQGVFIGGANSTQSVIASDVTPFVINRVGTGGNDRNCIEFRNNGTLRGTIGAIGASNGIFFQSATSEAMRIDSSGNVGIGTTGANNRLEIASSAHYVVTNSGQARNGLHIRGQGGNSGEFGGAISFGCNNTGAAAIAAEQMSSDSDVVGLSFFTHSSSTGTDDAKKRVKIMSNGGIILNNYDSTRGYIFQKLGTGTYPDFANVQGSSGRGMCDGQRVVSANTATEIAKSHWGGLAIVGYSNSQHQGTAQVMFGYGNAGASVKFEGHWVRQESLTITFSMNLYSLRITHNASNDLTVWCVLIGV